MARQPGLFDQPVEFNLRHARAARDEALARVEAHAAPRFLDLAVLAIQRVALRQSYLTTDDIWKELGQEPPPHEPRAMGAAMQRAKALGYVEPTDGSEQSAMTRCHARPKRVWRSLIVRV